MADPIPLLNLVPKAPNADVVAYLKRLLVEAEAGDLQAIAVVTRKRDGCFDTHWIEGSFVDFGLAAGIHRLDFRFQTEGFPPAILAGEPDDGA